MHYHRRMSENLGLAEFDIATTMCNRWWRNILHGWFWWTSDSYGRWRTKTDWKCFMGSLKMQEGWFSIRFALKKRFTLEFVDYDEIHITEWIFQRCKLIHVMPIPKSINGLKKMLNSITNFEYHIFYNFQFQLF